MSASAFYPFINHTHLLPAAGLLFNGHLGSVALLGTQTGNPEKLVIEGFSSSAVKNGRSVNPLLYTARGSFILKVGPFLIFIAPSTSRRSITPDDPPKSS